MRHLKYYSYLWKFNDKLDKKWIVFCLSIGCIKLYCGSVEVNRGFPEIDRSGNAARIVLGLKFIFFQHLITIWLRFGQLFYNQQFSQGFILPLQDLQFKPLLSMYEIFSCHHMLIFHNLQTP